MWVHYGENGKGVSIILNENFFINEDLYEVQYIDIDNFNIYKSKKRTINEIKKLKCYSEEESLQELVKKLEKEESLKKYLKKIIEILSKYPYDESKENKQFINLINNLLMYLSYVIKDKSYEYENEVRLIKFKTYEEAIIDKNMDIPKLYIDFEKSITSKMIDEIIIGPKGDFEAISAYAKYVGIKKVTKSNIKYR